MIRMSGKEYAIDVQKVFEFVNYSDKNTSSEQEITDGYEMLDDGKGSLRQTSKVIRELKAPGNSQIDNIKYDLVKSLISMLITFDDTDRDYDEDDLPFGVRITMNTLIAEGLLYEIEK